MAIESFLMYATLGPSLTRFIRFFLLPFVTRGTHYVAGLETVDVRPGSLILYHILQIAFYNIITSIIYFKMSYKV